MRRYAWKTGRRGLACAAVLAALAAGGCSSPDPAAPVPDPAPAESEPPLVVRAAHESVDNPQDIDTDERGLRVEGMGIDFPARRYPAGTEFPTGPALGERLPEFTLTNQDGEPVDFHADRGGQGAVVVFYRSAVW